MSSAQNYSEEIVSGGDTLVLVPESVNLSALFPSNYTNKYAIAGRGGLNPLDDARSTRPTAQAGSLEDGH